MRNRVMFFTGLAAGFVLGARAGRERYEQMKTLARRATDHPAVQQAAGTAAAQATGLAKTATNKVADRVQQHGPAFANTAIQRASERLPGWRDPQAGTGAEPGAGTGAEPGAGTGAEPGAGTDGVPTAPTSGGPTDG